MSTTGIVLGILIGLNIIISIAKRNWFAVCGWFVAGLEWTRRMSVG